MTRAFNFSADPVVLQQGQHELFDWCGSGMLVMEMSRRS